MNWDRIEGNWKQFKGNGITKDEAEKQVDLFGGKFRDEDLREYL